MGRLLLTPAVVAAVTAWWAVLQPRVVQIRHRAGGAAPCRQPSCPPRQRRPAVNLIAHSFSGRATLHRPLGSPQPAQLRRQRPTAVLQILQVSAAVERPPVDAAGSAAPIAGLWGARMGVVGLGPTGTGVALTEPRAGRDGDLPGPARLPAAHQVSPPLAWPPGSDQPTKQAGTARSEPHRSSTVLPRPVGLAGYGLSAAGDPSRNGRRPRHPGAPDRPAMTFPARVGLTRPTPDSWIVRWAVTWHAATEAEQVTIGAR